MYFERGISWLFDMPRGSFRLKTVLPVRPKGPLRYFMAGINAAGVEKVSVEKISAENNVGK